MALREGTRRWLMRLSWAALLIASSALVGVRIGRPVYYTDGAREIVGGELAAAGMLRWSTPEVMVEVPGPVAGRIVELPDGRLLYGRLGDDGTSDLVVWDPQRTNVPPEAVHGLNTEHNELAPALGFDGRVYFASDRDGGAGGYDLYVAPRLLAAGAEITPMPACATALDETDPAPHGNGVDFVFVRSDRRIDDGNHGALWRWRLGDTFDPVPLFDPPPTPGRRVIQRDPVFAADGAALWFVQKVVPGRLQVVRASMLNGAFDAPAVVGEQWGTGELRSPSPAADGRRLGLWSPRAGERDGDAGADVWYVATAHEVYPWWPGQRWLEWLLVAIAAASALLLVLLHLGRRWSALDLVAQCLLLSMLLHLLLFLWLMGVQVTGALLPGDDDAGGFEVNVVAASTASAAGSLAGGVGADVAFAPAERSLAADAPRSEAVRAAAGAGLAAPAGEWQHTTGARAVDARPVLDDASSDVVERRDGSDAAAPVAAAALDAVDSTAAQRAAAPSSARAAAAPAPSSVQVAVPGSGLARPSSSRSLAAAPAPSAAAPLGGGKQLAVATPALRDAAPATGAPAPASSVAEEPRPAIAAPLPLAGVAPARAAVAPTRTAAPSAAPSRAVAAPASSLVRARPTAPALPAPQPVASTNKNAYSNRFGPAKTKALEQFGGTDATERAVANGLRYLARIQKADGSWGDRDRFDGKYGLVHVGKTALCVLAFLGAGHTPQSNSEHSAVVQKAIAHLLALQDDDGAFGPSSCYGHGIATYAIAECYGLTKQPELLPPLERALTWILDHQGPRRDKRNRGGWGYFSPGLQPEDDYARVSVTAWMVMALESARLSGIELPDDVLPRAREYLELSYDQPNGWFRYNHKPSRLNSSWPTLPASTPAAAFCLMLLGAGPGDPKVDAATGYTVERRPEAYRKYTDDEFVRNGQGNVYFWYYGTLCCFLAGGERWADWNATLRTVLPAAQANDGSFPPIDVYAQYAGDTRADRSYTTAMCVLCLEVYYRYFTPLLLGR